MNGCNPIFDSYYDGLAFAALHLGPSLYSDCCSKCKENSNCSAYDHHETTCRLFNKSAILGRVSGAYYTNGRIDRNFKSCACKKLSYSVDADTPPQEITSPSYPQPSCNNVKCFYVLTSSDEAKSVKVTFDHVEMNRPEDSLKIFEGESNYTDVTNRIALITGISNETKTFVSRSHTMIFEFSSSSDGMRGFHATYEQVKSPCACPANNDFSSPSGNFSSPGYPKNYCDKLECTYKFEAPTGRVVKLNFKGVTLERNADYIKVYNPSMGTDQIIQSWTGSISSDFQFVSNTNKLNLLFKTDHSSTMQGFFGEYSYVSRHSNCVCEGPLPKRITSVSGQLKSPHHPSTYCGPLDCVWEVIPPSHNHRLIVNITDFSTRGPLDGLTIYKGTPRSDNRLVAVKRFFGNVQSQTVQLDSHRDDGFTFAFHTESGATSDTETGFSLNYEWKQKCQCSQSPKRLQATAEGAFLLSPDYPGEYCNNLNCQWLITAPQYHKVHIRITSFRTESGEDFLTLYDGDTKSSLQLARYSGRHSLHHTYLVGSSGQFILVHFATDGSVSYPGWKLFYSSEPIHLSSDQPIRTSPVVTRTPFPQGKTTIPKTIGPIITQNPKATSARSSSSGWSVLGPIFLVLLLIISSALLYVFVLKDRLSGWYADLRTLSGGRNSHASAGIIQPGYSIHRDSQVQLVTDD